jgi:hypothetical protein
LPRTAGWMLGCRPLYCPAYRGLTWLDTLDRHALVQPKSARVRSRHMLVRSLLQVDHQLSSTRD